MSSKHDIAVSVRGLSKAYTIAHNDERQVTLAEQVLHRLKNPFKRPTTETFHALKDVEFDIKKGDVVGIIGRNGAGKSTLLKILSRITEPTAGEIRLYGRVGSLLEVGTGFHPELTGRENIYLNGQILGMRKREIDKQFDAIVDFAGVEKFLDTPVKRYSSGMYVRLAFAVAAHLESEILIVDEVLAVGDAEFQRKCLGKMQDVSRDGRTVLFVSHNDAVIRTFCNTGLLFEQGELKLSAEVNTVLDAYAKARRSGGGAKTKSRAAAAAPARLERVAVLGHDGVHTTNLRALKPFRVEMEIALEHAIRDLKASVEISTTLGHKIHTAYSGFKEGRFDLEAGRHTLVCDFRGLDLVPGEYSLNVWLGTDLHTFVFEQDILPLSVVAQELTDVYGTVRFPTSWHGPLRIDFDWKLIAAVENCA